MAWIYLAELVELRPDLKNLFGHWPTVKSTPIAKVSSCRECKKEICPKHQYGMIYPVFPHQNWEEDLAISSRQASPARISALQEREKDWMESAADFFSRSCAWPKNSSPHSYSLKTSLPLQAEGDFESLEKLPRWGMIVDGVLYPLRPLEPCTKENAGSYWPTPRARNPGDCPAERRRDNPALESVVNMQQSTRGKKLCPRWVSCLMGYPTTWTDLKPLETL